MKYTQSNQKLNAKSLKEAIEFLCKKDSDLNQIIKKGRKQINLFKRPSGFTGLINLIVEQQLSVASAKAIFERLKGSIVPFSAKQFLRTEKKVLKTAGLSPQKIGYCLGIAKACLEGDINFNALEKMSNENIVEQLVKFKGVGEWTAQCYLLGCMSRIDAWPASDLGLQVAIQRIKSLEERPTGLTVEEIAEPWKPFRSVAALILWSSYD